MRSDVLESRGDFPRRLHDLEREVQRMRAARRGENMTISAGGIDVAGGNIIIRTGGLEVLNAGYIGSKYPSGRTAFFVGQFVNSSGAVSSTGLRMERDVSADEGDFLFEVNAGVDGSTHLYSGYPGSELDQCRAWADFWSVDATDIYLVTPNETTDTANVVLDATGHLFRIGSRAALKLDVQPLAITPADVLGGLAPVTWIDKGQHERGEPERRIVGFVAEQVAAAASATPALAPLVLPDAAGAPAGIAYERVPAMHHVVLVDHDERLTAVEATVVELRQENTELRTELAELRALVETLTASKEAP